MKITIAERLHPFSHRPGVTCMLPNSQWKVQIFPTRLCLEQMVFPFEKREELLEIEGPVEGFTVEVDLEKAWIRVFGKSPQGHQCYRITHHPDAITIAFEKTQKTLSLPLKQDAHLENLPQERLSLGMHKAQDWDLVLRRNDLKEIFPIWLRLGQITPQAPLNSDAGTLKLLEKCKNAIDAAKRIDVYKLFSQLGQAAFSGILVPRLVDEEHQGIVSSKDPATPDVSALPLLTEGSQLIRSLFFQEKDEKWHLMPCLLPEFACGRFTGIQTASGDQLSLEWSKHYIQKMIIQPSHSRTVHLQFPSETTAMRYRHRLEEKGKTLNLIKGATTLELQQGKVLYLDRFMK